MGNKWLPLLGKTLVGVFAVSVIVAIVWPIFLGSRPVSRSTSQLSRIKQDGLCLIMYANDYDGKMPPAMFTNQDLRHYAMPYTTGSEIFRSINPNGGQIQGNGLLATKVCDDLADSSTVVMLYDSRPWTDGHAVLCYADGHGKAVVPFETMLLQLTTTPIFGKKAAHE